MADVVSWKAKSKRPEPGHVRVNTWGIVDFSGIEAEQDITTLDIETLNVEIPSQVFALPNLRRLRLHCYHLADFTADIDRLVDLEYLEVTSNKLEALPSTIGNLQNIKCLKIARVPSVGIPDSVWGLKKLEQLELNTKFEKVPAGIGALRRLKHVKLGAGGFATLPDSFGDLGDLEELDIFAAKFVGLPDCFARLKKLRRLEMRCCEIEEFSVAAIGEGCALQDLNIENNKLTTFPAEISRYQNLEVLVASRNPLQHLPDEMGTLPALRVLDIAQGKLRGVPATFGDLPRIERICAASNEIENLPGTLGKASTLRELRLGGNKLKTLPHSIGMLPVLETLSVEENEIETLPGEVAHLAKLNYFGLWSNPFTYKQRNKKAEAILKLIASFTDESNEARTLQMWLQLGDIERAKACATLELVGAALNSTQKLVRTNAAVVLTELLDDPLQESTDGYVLGLVGSFTGLKVKEVNGLLAKVHAKAKKGLNKDTTHVVLSEKPKDGWDKAQASGLPLATEAHLRAQLRRIESPYLEDDGQTASSMRENLADLLSSVDATNALLGLELCASGGVPDKLRPLVLAVARAHPNQKARKTAVKVFAKTAPPDLQAAITNILKRTTLLPGNDARGDKYYKKLEQLDGFDEYQFAVAVFRFSQIGRGYLFARGGPATLEVLQAHVKGDYLDISDTGDRNVRVLPAEVGQLSNLRGIHVHGRLKDLPVTIAKLQKLETLHLDYNSFRRIPEAVFELRALKHLSLVCNVVTAIPPAVGKLKHLETLDLTATLVSKLPEELGRCAKLRMFKVSGAAMKTLPKSFAALVQLTELELDNLKLKEFPAEVCELGNLESLSMRLTGFESLPVKLGKLKKLRKLDLCRTRLTSVPAQIFELTELEDLNLDSARIAEIPIELAGLTKLRRLSIGTNPIKEIPAALAKLPLEELHLDYTLVPKASHAKINNMFPNAKVTF